MRFQDAQRITKQGEILLPSLRGCATVWGGWISLQGQSHGSLLGSGGLEDSHREAPLQCWDCLSEPVPATLSTSLEHCGSLVHGAVTLGLLKEARV